DLISDSDNGDEFEWNSDGDGEVGSLNGACSSAQASRNLHAPGPSTLVRLVKVRKNAWIELISPAIYLLITCVYLLWKSYGYDLDVVFSYGTEKDSNGKKDSGAGPSAYMLDYFVGMGFSKEMVLKAMMEDGGGGEDSLLDRLFKYKEIGCNPLVDDDSFGYVPCTVDDDDGILENWDDDDAGDKSNKDPNSDDSADETLATPSVPKEKQVILGILGQTNTQGNSPSCPSLLE
ncbi:hypothetical protein BAE44_0014235, partial [Dichanthelium oligosanthes]